MAAGLNAMYHCVCCVTLGFSHNLLTIRMRKVVNRNLRWGIGKGYKNIPRPLHPFHSVTSTGFIIFKLSKMLMQISAFLNETVVHVPNSFSGMLCGIPLMTSR